MNVHHLTLEHVSDDALMSRVFELARSGKENSVEASQVDAAIFARLLETYGDDNTPAQAGRHAA